MSPLGVPLGRTGPTAAPPPPPPPTAGSEPVAAATPGAGAGTGSVAGGDAGTSGGATTGGGAGTPVTAPATRHAFGQAAAPTGSGERQRVLALQHQRRWRMTDVVAAISGGPRARLLIEAAGRPGPVAPGSLLEAVKALRPAPTPPGETRTV